MATADFKKLYDEAAGDKSKYMTAALLLPTGKTSALLMWLQFERKKAEFRTDVVYIEGAVVSTITLPEFSQAAVMTHMELTEAELDNATGDDATALTTQHMIDRTIVTVFNSEGEAFFFIGPNSKWLG